MKKQKRLSIELMKFPEDKNEIAEWQDKYNDDKDFESIRHYILEDQTYIGLGEVIETNHEIFPIGIDEKKFAFVGKNETGEIVAWSLVDFFDINTDCPEMFIQYIVVHPKHQNKGYGKELASELILNPKKYIGGKPGSFFAYIDKSNESSRALFEKLGFDFKEMTPKFLRAHTEQPRLESDASAKSFGE